MPEDNGEKDHMHLGDGVYVSHDGYHILLRANSHDAPEKIALEPEVLEALDRYVKKIKERYGRS